MIELTPLDVRKKKGDFRRGLRGYETALVDDFLDLVADRLEVLVREAASMGERVARLEQQVADYRDRERALTEALVTAQQMREDIRTQSTREVELLRRQAEQEASQIKAEAVQSREHEEEALRSLRARQTQVISSYKAFLEQEISHLNAMARGLDMHAGSMPAPPAAPPVMPSHTPPAQSPAASTEPAKTAPPAPPPPPARPPVMERPAAPAAEASPYARGPVSSVASPASPASPPLPRPGPVPSPRMAERPEPRGEISTATRSEPSRTNVRQGGAGRATEPPRAASGLALPMDEVEAQLEEALARWEPELEQELELGSDDAEDDALVQEMELLLSDDDVVGANRNDDEENEPEASAPADTDDDDEVLEFLGLMEDDEPADDSEADDAVASSPAMPAATTAEAPMPAPPAAPQRTDAQRAELAREASAALPETESASSELIDLDDAFGEPPVTPAAQADAESAVAEEPEPTPTAALEEAFEEAPPEPVADGHTDAGNGHSSNGRDLIDLDALGSISNFDLPGPGSGDTSTLTLHPMFFDQESSDLPGIKESRDKAKDERRDRWSSSGGG